MSVLPTPELAAGCRCPGWILPQLPLGGAPQGRSAAAAGSSGYLTTYRWDSDGDSLRLRVHAEPVGHWPERGDDFSDPMVDPALPPEEYQELVRRNRSCSLARIGLDWELPADRSQVEWFGTGPGEAHPDSRQAVRVGRFRATVGELQTPYVRPQENGNRADIRWATFTDGAGRGLRVVGAARQGAEVDADRVLLRFLGIRGGRERLG